MTVMNYRVSERGQMALPAETRRRWGIAAGGTVEIVDLDDAVIVVPADRGGLRSMLGQAVEDAGGYATLARRVADSDPDLA